MAGAGYWKTIKVYDAVRDAMVSKQVWVAGSKKVDDLQKNEAAKRAREAAARRARAAAKKAAEARALQERQRALVRGKTAENRKAAYDRLAAMQQYYVRQAGLVRDTPKPPRTEEQRERDRLQAAQRKAEWAGRQRTVNKDSYGLDPVSQGGAALEGRLQTQADKAKGGVIDPTQAQRDWGLYQDYVAGVSARYRSFVEQFMALEKAGDKQGMYNLLKDKGFEDAASEFTRVFGEGNEQGSLYKAVNSYEYVRERQQELWARTLRGTFDEELDRQLTTIRRLEQSGDLADQRKARELRKQLDTTQNLANLAEARRRPGYKKELQVDADGNVKIGTGERRTAEEEAAYREAEARREIERLYRHYNENIKPGRENFNDRIGSAEGVLKSIETGSVRDNSEAFHASLASYKALLRSWGVPEENMEQGLRDLLNGLQNPVSRQETIRAAMKLWDTQNRATFIGGNPIAPPLPNQASSAADPRALRYQQAWAQKERELYEFIGANPPSPIEQFFSNPFPAGFLTAISLPFGVVGAGIFRAIPTILAGKPAQAVLSAGNVTLDKLPFEVRERILRETNKLRSDPAFKAQIMRNYPAFTDWQLEAAVKAAQREAANRWLTETPEGKRWATDNDLLVQRVGAVDTDTARNENERQRLIDELTSMSKDLYGNDPGKAAQWLATYGNEPFTPDSAAANLLSGLLMDPLNVVPLKFNTFLARARYAAEASAKGRTILGSSKLRSMTDFLSVTEDELEMFKELKALSKKSKSGLTEDQIINELQEATHGIKDLAERRSAAQQKLKELGFKDEDINIKQLDTMIQYRLQEKADMSGFNYKDQKRIAEEEEAAAKAKAEAERLRHTAEVERAARSADAAETARMRAREDTRNELYEARQRQATETQRQLQKAEAEASEALRKEQVRVRRSNAAKKGWETRRARRESLSPEAEAARAERHVARAAEEAKPGLKKTKAPRDRGVQYGPFDSPAYGPPRPLGSAPVARSAAAVSNSTRRAVRLQRWALGKRTVANAPDAGTTLPKEMRIQTPQESAARREARTGSDSPDIHDIEVRRAVTLDTKFGDDEIGTPFRGDSLGLRWPEGDPFLETNYYERRATDIMDEDMPMSTRQESVSDLEELARVRRNRVETRMEDEAYGIDADPRVHRERLAPSKYDVAERSGLSLDSVKVIDTEARAQRNLLVEAEMQTLGTLRHLRNHIFRHKNLPADSARVKAAERHLEKFVLHRSDDGVSRISIADDVDEAMEAGAMPIGRVIVQAFHRSPMALGHLYESFGRHTSRKAVDVWRAIAGKNKNLAVVADNIETWFGQSQRSGYLRSLSPATFTERLNAMQKYLDLANSPNAGGVADYAMAQLWGALASVNFEMFHRIRLSVVGKNVDGIGGWDGMAKLSQFHDAAVLMLEKNPNNLMAQQWLLMEQRAGLEFAQSYDAVTKGFIAAMEDFPGLAPDLAIMQIPNGYFGRTLPDLSEWSPNLKGLGESGLTRIKWMGSNWWTHEKTFDDVLQRLAEVREPHLVGNVGLLIHFLVRRYGDRAALPLRREIKGIRAHVQSNIVAHIRESRRAALVPTELGAALDAAQKDLNRVIGGIKRRKDFPKKADYATEKDFLDARGAFIRKHLDGTPEYRRKVELEAHIASLLVGDGNEASHRLWGAILDFFPERLDAVTERRLRRVMETGHGTNLELKAVDDAIEAAYNVGALTHANPNLHTLQYVVRLQAHTGSKGWIRISENYLTHMEGIGFGDLARNVILDIQGRHLKNFNASLAHRYAGMTQKQLDSLPIGKTADEELRLWRKVGGMKDLDEAHATAAQQKARSVMDPDEFAKETRDEWEAAAREEKGVPYHRRVTDTVVEVEERVGHFLRAFEYSQKASNWKRKLAPADRDRLYSLLLGEDRLALQSAIWRLVKLMDDAAHGLDSETMAQINDLRLNWFGGRRVTRKLDPETGKHIEVEEFVKGKFHETPALEKILDDIVEERGNELVDNLVMQSHPAIAARRMAMEADRKAAQDILKEAEGQARQKVAKEARALRRDEFASDEAYEKALKAQADEEADAASLVAAAERDLKVVDEEIAAYDRKFPVAPADKAEVAQVTEAINAAPTPTAILESIPTLPPEPLVRRVEELKARLALLTGMSEDQYLEWELNRAKDVFNRSARGSEQRRLAAVRISDINRVKEGRRVRARRGSLVRSQDRLKYTQKVLAKHGDEAAEMYSPREYAYYAESPQMADVETVRDLTRFLDKADVDDELSRVRGQGGASETYTKNKDALDKGLEGAMLPDSFWKGWAKPPKEPVSAMDLLVGWDDFSLSLAGHAQLAEMRRNLLVWVDRRLKTITGDKNYDIDQYLDDRIAVRGDHYDFDLYQKHNKLVSEAVVEETGGHRATVYATRKPVRTRKSNTPPKYQPQALDDAIDAIRAKVRVARENGFDIHAYNEARKVFRNPLTKRGKALSIIEEAKATGKSILDVRAVGAAEEGRNQLGVLARYEMYGADPDMLMQEFRLRYGFDKVLRTDTPRISSYQRRTIEAAIERLSGGTATYGDDAALGSYLRSAETLSSDSMRSRGAFSRLMERRGSWTKRTAEDFQEGRVKSWSWEEEAQWWWTNYRFIPEWCREDVLRGNPMFVDMGAYYQFHRDHGIFNRRFESGSVSREDVLRGNPEKGIKAKRDISMERKYAMERWGDLVYDADKKMFTAMPWLMNEGELRHWMARQTADTIADDLVRTSADLDELIYLIDSAIDDFWDAHFAGKVGGDITYEDIFHLADTIMYRLLEDPLWAKRTRDMLGHGVERWGKFWRLLVFSNPAFAVTNAVDATFVKGPWLRFQTRHLRTGLENISERARSFTPEDFGFGASIYGSFRGPQNAFQQLVNPRNKNALWRAFTRIEGFVSLPAGVAEKVEVATKMRLARQMYDKVYEAAIKDGKSPELADAFAINFVKRRVERMWPTVGDGPVEKLFNAIVPFASYQLKNNLLFISESLTHPAIYNWLNRIGNFIEQMNRERWEQEHPGEEPDPRQMRLIELPWAPGMFFDFGTLSDASRGLRVITEGSRDRTIVDHLAQWFRLANASQLTAARSFANALGMTDKVYWRPILDKNGYPTGRYERIAVPFTEPWSKDPATIWSIFWPLDVAESFKGLTNESITRTTMKLLFFGGVVEYDRMGGINAWFWQLKDDDPEAAAKFLTDTREGWELRMWWAENSGDPEPLMDPLAALRKEQNDKNPWLHSKSEDFQKQVRAGYDELRRLKNYYDNLLLDEIPGTPEYQRLKDERWLVILGVYRKYPELREFEVWTMSPQDWQKQLQEWEVDKLADVFFAMEEPKREDFKTETEWKNAREDFFLQRQEYLRRYPQVAEMLDRSRDAVERLYKDQQKEWASIYDRIAERGVKIDAAKAAKDYDELDLLYAANELDFKLLDEDRGIAYVDKRDVAALDKKFAPMPRYKVLVDAGTKAFLKDPEKYEKDKWYAKGMKAIIDKAKAGGEFDPAVFVRELKKNPALLEEYFAQNPGKREQWAANEAYIGYMGKWVALLDSGNIGKAMDYFESLPAWVKARYYAKHPEKKVKWQRSREYMGFMEKWVAFFEKGDYKGGKAFFDALPQWVKDRYYAKHPEAKEKAEIMEQAALLGEYFAADEAMRPRWLKEHPEFAKWLATQTTDAEWKRMALLEAYRTIKEPWLKKVMRERYPEVFSAEAKGERRLRSVYNSLAKHPEMLPFFEEWVESLWEGYRQNLQSMGARPREVKYDRSAQRRSKSRSAEETSR